MSDELSEGVRLHQSGRPEEALRHYMNALEQNPSDPGILCNIAVALHDCERYEEAVAIYNHVLTLAPNSAIAHHNLGNTLLAMERLHEAIASYDRAASLMPDSAEPLVPMGTALERLGRYHEAMGRYLEALQRDPVCAEAHWNLALLNLLLGNYQEGWQGFEWRWKKKGYPTPARNFCCPEWTGEIFTGKTVLIHAEQGLGDTIQFGRYIPLVAERGGRIILEVPLPLAGLFRQMPGVDKIIQTGTKLPAFDLHAPLLSLPRIFGTTLDSIPSKIPYLSVPVQHKKKWDYILPCNSTLKVGIVWKGRKTPDPARSCPCELLAALSGLGKIQFYSLQMSEDSNPTSKPGNLPLVDLTAWINDFSDTATLLDRLDLVISIDTAVAHLAGSLGCTTWVLLPFAADWRWMLNREDSPWYPDARLFRQTEPGGWQDLLNRVRAELIHWSAKTAPKRSSNTNQLGCTENSSLCFFSYIPNRDFYLGALHDGREVPLPKAEDSNDVNKADAADFYILSKDLYRLQNDLGIEGVNRFIKELPNYKTCPECHLFWSSHDNPVTPDETAIFCKTSVSLLERGRIIAVPYPVEDLACFGHFTPELIRWHTCFVGFPGSSQVRERLLLSVAGNHSISSRIDIAPKFHSHLDAETRQKRRHIYLETMAQSLTVLCPRGDGMSSIRFFEALSIGRLPVLISDWCALPFDSFIPYDRFVIRIAEGDVELAGELIANWVAEKSPEDLLARCHEARNTWEQWFSRSGIERALRTFLTVLNAADSPQLPTGLGGGHKALEDDLARANEALQEKNKQLSYGLQHYNEGRLEQAERCFKRANSESVADDEATTCLALLLNEQGRFEETINLLTHGQTRKPVTPELLRLLGEAYQSSGMAAAAYHQYLQAMPSFANDPQLLMNIGVVCEALDRPSEAISYLTSAVEIAPLNPQIHLNLGGVLQGLNLLEDAEASYRQALNLDSGYATAAWNLAQILLLKGNYLEGFGLFEARFAKRDPILPSGLDLPLWNGEPIDNRTIVVTTEQAFGDAIQFSRYTSLLADLGAQVIIFNHLAPLQTLLESIRGVSAVISDSAHLPPADFQIPMLSLPRLFGTTVETIPTVVPYLRPAPSKVREWAEKLQPATGLRIGLAWAGRQTPDPRRSAALSDFAPLGKIPGIQLISLQIGPGSEVGLSPPAGMLLLDKTWEINDFEDTAAIIANLDLIISVDTSVAHLAGAMGKPVWLLLPFAPDWRWLLERCDSPWYPTMRIFRQETSGEWGIVVSKITSELSCHAA